MLSRTDSFFSSLGNRRNKVLLFSLLLIGAVSSCRSRPLSETKDTFTVTRDGKVLLFRGGPKEVVVRKCPDFAALKEAADKDQIESQINTLCPKTDKNEKIFATSAVRSLVKEHYQRTYIPNGVPVDKALKGVAASAADKAALAKAEAEKNRAELNNNIPSVEGELSRLNAYYDANPELLTEDIRAKLKQLATTLADHKTRLAGLSDQKNHKVL